MTPNKINTPYQVPEGYFEQLSASILNTSIASAETEFENRTPFTTPEGYFDSLPISIRTKQTPKKNNWIAWSVAASVAMIVCGFAWFVLQPSKMEQDGLASVPQEQLVNYLALEQTSDVQFMVESEPSLVTDSIAKQITQQYLPVSTKDFDEMLDENPEFELTID